MYLPAHFVETDAESITALIEAAPLAAVVAQTAAGLIANHLPLLRAPNGDLIGHVARNNDMHQLIAPDQEVLAIFRGEQSYISPNDYPSKPEHHRHVPTWNYQVVHITGQIRFSDDLAQRRAAVGLLTRHHERRRNGDAAWRMADAPADYLEEMLAAIVAFKITPSRILAKSKLSQNRSAQDYQGAIHGLQAHGKSALAQIMQQRPDAPK